jgi:hypothetical protein
MSTPQFNSYLGGLHFNKSRAAGMMADSSAQYQYSRLNSAPLEIRLVRLIGNLATEGFALEIVTSTLEAAPRYVALSYRWGDPTRNQTVTADGGVVKITVTLRDFFLAVRARCETSLQPNVDDWFHGWMWIDAVCINQDDLTERSEQVRFMKEIYERAAGMVIWLSEVTGDLGDAMQCLTQVSALELGEDSLCVKNGPELGTSFLIGTERGYVQASHATLMTVSALMNDTYWDRAWIIQEASTPLENAAQPTLSTPVVVCIGNSTTIPWATYARANQRLMQASWANEAHEHINMHDVANSNVATVHYLKELRRLKATDSPLYPTLVRTRSSDATDPRDKLYAILGLVDERDAVGIQPNYKLSVSEITLSQSLDSLGSAGTHRGSGVPSWVPDWSIQHETAPQPFYQKHITPSQKLGVPKAQRSLFACSRGVPMDVAFDTAEKGLLASGFIFDRIVAVSSCRPWPDEQVEERWKDWVSVAMPDNRNPDYLTGCSRREAFARTLKADFMAVHEDWSAERGDSQEGIASPGTNAFELHDGILDAMTWQRSVFTTSKGYLGLAPGTTTSQDYVCILCGSQMPLVLRKDGAHWELVGQAYVHGIMDGEALDGVNLKDVEQRFTIY